MKITEIKLLFEVKQMVRKNLQNATSLNDLRQKLQEDGFKIRVQYKGEFKPNQQNEIQDIFINKVQPFDMGQQKDGFFFKKYQGFSFSAIDDNFTEVITMKSQIQTMTTPAMQRKDSVLEIAEELIEDVLKPNYVAQQEDDWWKKKRKGRR